MKRLLCLLIAAVACVSLSFALAQEPAVPKKVEPNPKTVPPGWQDGPGPVQPPSSVVGRRTLTLREARKNGITFQSIRAHRKALLESGDIEATMSSAEEAVVMFERFSDANPKAFGEKADIDAWLALFEMLIDLIKRFFPS